MYRTLRVNLEIYEHVVNAIPMGRFAPVHPVSAGA